MSKQIDFRVAKPWQDERAAYLKAEVPQRTSKLLRDQVLIVGIKPVIGEYEDSIVLVVDATMTEATLLWIDHNEEAITGPVYNLPRLIAEVVFLVVDGKTFDSVEAQTDPEFCPIVQRLSVAVQKFQQPPKAA